MDGFTLLGVIVTILGGIGMILAGTGYFTQDETDYKIRDSLPERERIIFDIRRCNRRNDIDGVFFNGLMLRQYDKNHGVQDEKD